MAEELVIAIDLIILGIFFGSVLGLALGSVLGSGYGPVDLVRDIRHDLRAAWRFVRFLLVEPKP